MSHLAVLLLLRQEYADQADSSRVTKNVDLFVPTCIILPVSYLRFYSKMSADLTLVVDTETQARIQAYRVEQVRK
ncbi:MAG: hypothetical protein OEV07_17955, partial [Gammaproteobacteria bacterium]|nr:hypothetical protein [Gammaproteobacteria bacterium]